MEPPRGKIAVPKLMEHLPVNKAGYIVPWFVATIDGEPDFRVIRPEAIVAAVNEKRCWVCGLRIVIRPTFVIGPMCAVNRVSAEPPSHIECARYSVQVCPFIINPKKRRRESGKPEGTVDPAGEMITRNPGVILLWTSKPGAWKPFSPPAGNEGVLFDVGEPSYVEWWANGRAATRAEVLESINSGLPILRESAEAQGPEAVTELYRMRKRAMELVPV
jgi:hypothetical protein